MTTHPDATTYEEGFVNAFILKDRRERLHFELHKRRGEFLSRFSHSALDYLIPRCVEAIGPISGPDHLLKLLKSRGAGRTCYAISMADDIDGKVLPLPEALSVAYGLGLSTILICRPGELAYLETEQIEGPPQRFVLCRTL